jgi:hypothetical protein
MLLGLLVGIAITSLLFGLQSASRLPEHQNEKTQRPIEFRILPSGAAALQSNDGNLDEIAVPLPKVPKPPLISLPDGKDAPEIKSKPLPSSTGKSKQ